MAKRLLDAAKAATQLAAWSDLKYNISDDGSSVVSEDSEDDLLSAKDNDDETNENMNDPSPVNSPGARTSEDNLLSAGDNDDETNENMNDPSPVNSPGARTSGQDEMSDSSEEKSDSDDSTESSDTVTQSTFRGTNGQVLHHQEHVHVISDTPEKNQSEMQKTSKMK